MEEDHYMNVNRNAETDLESLNAATPALDQKRRTADNFYKPSFLEH